MKKFSVSILLCLLFLPVMNLTGEISKNKEYITESKEELNEQEVEIITNYDLLEIFEMLEEWDLFDNYEVFVDTITE